MTRLEALERVASAVRHYIHGDGYFEAVRGALDALDTIPPEPAGEVVDVAVWLDPDDGEVRFCRPQSEEDEPLLGWTRLGTTRLPIARAEVQS